MPATIGLDTSFVIGLLDEKDLWHTPTAQLYDDIQAREFQMAAFDCVLAETVGALARRVHEKRRRVDLASLLDHLRFKFPTKSITWLYPELPDIYDEVVTLVERSNGELNFNRVECLNILSWVAFGQEYLDIDGGHRLGARAHWVRTGWKNLWVRQRTAEQDAVRPIEARSA